MSSGPFTPSVGRTLAMLAGSPQHSLQWVSSFLVSLSTETMMFWTTHAATINKMTAPTGKEFKNLRNDYQGLWPKHLLGLTLVLTRCNNFFSAMGILGFAWHERLGYNCWLNMLSDGMILSALQAKVSFDWCKIVDLFPTPMLWLWNNCILPWV